MEDYDKECFDLEKILDELVLETWDIYGHKVVYQVKAL